MFCEGKMTQLPRLPVFLEFSTHGEVETGNEWWPCRRGLKRCVLHLVCELCASVPAHTFTHSVVLYCLSWVAKVYKQCSKKLASYVYYWPFSTACESQNLGAHLDLSLAHPSQRFGKSLLGLLFPFYWRSFSVPWRGSGLPLIHSF